MAGTGRKVWCDRGMSDSLSNSDPHNHAFIAVSRKYRAHSISIDKSAWFDDSGATEHMAERKEWFSTFKPTPSGHWSVAVADDREI